MKERCVMVRFLSGLFASITGSARSRKASPAPRRTQPGLEVLEGRALMSVSPIQAFTGPVHLVQQTAVVHPVVASVWQVNPGTNRVAPPAVLDVPNLKGFTFYLVSANGKPAHELTIQTEIFKADGSATITGTWAGKSGMGHQILNGRIYYDVNGNVEISFAWTNGTGGQNTFLGTITPNTSPASANSVYGPRYHLEGDVTAASPSDGPGHVSGNGSLAPPMLSATV